MKISAIKETPLYYAQNEHWPNQCIQSMHIIHCHVDRRLKAVGPCENDVPVNMYVEVSFKSSYVDCDASSAHGYVAGN